MESKGTESKGMEILVGNDGFSVKGHEPIPALWQDFSVAETFGDDGITDTYERISSEWRGDRVYWRWLCLVLNHKLWFWHERDDQQRAALYGNLWRDAEMVASGWPEGEREYHFTMAG